MNTTMAVDIHTHFWPRPFLEGCRSGRFRIRFVEDEKGIRLEYPDDYMFLYPPHWDPEVRIAAMRQVGLDHAVITPTVPGPDIEPPDTAIAATRLMNDSLAEVMHQYPDWFTALAALPMVEPKAAASELRRAVEELGLAGANIYSNVNGTPLHDRQFWSVWEAAATLDVPIVIHPTMPASTAGMEDFRLTAVIGFPANTALAAAGLVFAGVMDAFPRLKLVLGHMGGALPSLIGRIQRSSETFPECRGRLKRPARDYFARMYFDTCNYDPDAATAILDWLPEDHLMLGSDWPQINGDLEGCIPGVLSMPIADKVKAKILGGNAVKLFRIKAARRV